VERSSRFAFLRSLALAIGEGFLFGVAMKLAQERSKTREDEVTDLGPLAERLRKVEEQTQTIDKDALLKFGEGLDGRVLEKVTVALEARLTEHVGQVDRRLAEIDAQIALDLKAMYSHTAAQTNVVEKAMQQIEAQVRGYVAEAQQASAEQITGRDQKLSALQENLPARFREIIEAVRQSMEARVALEMTELENRVSSHGVASEELQELQANLRGEVGALSGRLSAEMRELTEHQQSQTAPLQQALQQLETKLTMLREELPPKIRQIVETVEASMHARISAGDQQTAGRMASLEQGLNALRAEMPNAGGFRQAVEDDLQRHAEEVGALDRKLTLLQEELPPKIKAIVDAVRESLDARMAVEQQGIEERHSEQLRQSEARFSEAQEQHRTQIEQLEERLRAERAPENVPAQIDSAVAGLRQAMEAKLAAEIHELEVRTLDRSSDLEKALQYASLLETRVQALEQQLQRSTEETVDRAAEQVWRAIESRLQQREAHARQAAAPALETISGLRQKSTSAEQSVLDLIAGLGQLFEKPAAQAVRGIAPTVAQLHAVAEPATAAPASPAVESEPEAKAEPTHVIGKPALVAMAPKPTGEPAAAPPGLQEAAAAPAEATVDEGEIAKLLEEKPPVILFRPKDSGRKWRIPFVSSFLLMAAAIAWLQLM
jgi:hypothetical protein